MGQHAAQQDCNYRAMAKGMRWVASIDYDEFLALKPAGEGGWEPPKLDVATPMSSFVEWARQVPVPTGEEGSKQQVAGAKGIVKTIADKDADFLELNIPELTRGLLPNAFGFQSSFICPNCRPLNEPDPADANVQAITKQYDGLDWLKPGIGVPLAFSSPVRIDDWFPTPMRMKAIIDPW